MKQVLRFLHQWGSPKYFFFYSKKFTPWLGIAFILLFSYGLVGGLYLAPADYQQGEGFRIIYVHVPCAFLSLGIYVFMSFCAIASFVWRIKLADLAIKAAAPIGAWITFLTLVTGSLWGKPMWGTYWVWDARLTAELILLFLYFGVIALQNAISDPTRAAQVVRILVLVGIVNIPIIHYSVYWWNTLHQGNTLNLFSPSLIAPEMLYPLLAMLAAFSIYFVMLLFARLRHEILQTEYKTQWVKEWIQQR